jgi:hypothetical protein
MRDTFANGRRHYADEWAAQMRDRFGIEYSNFVPRGVHRKVLATPVTPEQIAGRHLRLVVADYEVVDADFVNWLDQQRDADCFLVAGVTGDRLDESATERLALANSLATVDHAVLIESEGDLRDPIAGVTPEDVVMHPDIAASKTP